MRAITWSWSHHLLETRLFPSSDVSNNNSENNEWHNWSGPTRQVLKQWTARPPVLQFLPTKCTCEWDHLTMHTFCSLILCLFKAKAHVCTPEDGWRWAEALTLPLPTGVPGCIISFLCPSTGFFIWLTGASGQTWHVESQEFGHRA
jgi:hypothetical protein